MKKNILLVGSLCGIVLVMYIGSYLKTRKVVQKEDIETVLAQTDTSESISFSEKVLEIFSPKEEEIVEVLREETPVRGIYVSAPAMHSPKVRARIQEIVETTRINALVIDVKDSSGYVFLPNSISAHSFANTPYSTPALEFIKSLKEKDVYLIARIVVFQDPLTAKHFPEYALKNKDGSIWRDRKGMAFLDPQNKKVWEYAKQLSLDTYNFGFDEINYDYIRYPSDGMISQISYHIPESMTKSDMVEKFFAYIHEEMRIKNGVYISADIFGDTVRLKGDPGVGQTLEKTFPYFDAVAPMVYPSHFSPGSYGMKNPDASPKEIMEGIAFDMNRKLNAWCPVVSSVIDGMSEKEIKKALEQYEREKQKICSPWKNRPWIQDFSLHAEYGVKEVKDQIDALEKAGITSWLVWNPSSRYTTEAFK